MIKNHQKKSITVIILVVTYVLSIIQSACTENSIPPEEDTSFSFYVKVVDDNNNPIQGIMVGSYYHTSYPMPKQINNQNILNPNATTNIRFAFDSECYGKLIVYDLENKEVTTLIENEQMNAGQYAIAFNATGLKGGVYKIKLIARSLANQTITFEDSIYSALLHLDPRYCKMGMTNSTGTFITNDKIYFPSLYTLPELTRTGEADPSPLGMFTITDKITIQLTDTVTNITKVFDKTIGKNKNEFILKFSEGTDAFYRGINGNIMSKQNHMKSTIKKINRYWSLEQNYPNPFN